MGGRELSHTGQTKKDWSVEQFPYCLEKYQCTVTLSLKLQLRVTHLHRK